MENAKLISLDLPFSSLVFMIIHSKKMISHSNYKEFPSKIYCMEKLNANSSQMEFFLQNFELEFGLQITISFLNIYDQNLALVCKQQKM